MEKLLMLWRESCGIFKKGQCQMFVLVVLQSVRLSLSAMLRYGWFPMVIALVVLFQAYDVVLASFVSSFQCLMSQSLINWARFVFTGVQLLVFFRLVIAIFMMVFAATRASVERKDMHYYTRYAFGGAYFFYFLLILPVVMVCPFVGYFLLDSNPSLRNTVKAVGKGFVVMVYCLPVAALFTAISGMLLLASVAFRPFMASIAPVAPTIAGELVRFFIGYFLPGVVFLLVVQVILSLYSVFYLRLKHTQRHFFF